MLGWDVGTFEFTSDRILAIGEFPKNTKLKLRTGGSSGVIPRRQCHATEENDGIYWDLTAKEGKHNVRLPVKFRYRAPVVMEFHTPGKRDAQAYAIIWIQHLTDNEDTPIDIPIWTTKQGNRLTQNYITEVSAKAHAMEGLDDLKEIGRLTFKGRFKAGTDESHEKFVTDNDSRETFETWEACLHEGVREREVSIEIPERTQSMHDESLTEGRDILKQQSPDERQKWIAKDGNDWSGAFGEDPAAFVDGKGRKIAEPGVDRPRHDPNNPSSDDDDDHDYDSDSSSDLGITDASNAKPSIDTERTDQTNGTTDSRKSVDSQLSKRSSKDTNAVNKKAEKRKQRGLMQWKPARNAAFAKDEALFAARRVKQRFTGGLGGREPGVETETGR